MIQRFFRTADAAIYEAVRLQLDAAWGHIAPMTCIEPAGSAPRDQQGRIVLAVYDEFCQYEAAAAMLPQLLASGAVEEIDAATYRGAMNLIPLPAPIPEGDTFPVSPSNPRFGR